MHIILHRVLWRLLIIFQFLYLFSCVNTFNEYDDTENTTSTDSASSNVAIGITSFELHNQVYDSENVKSESVGLYVVLSSSSLAKSRYISNEKYVLVGAGFRDVDGKAYYPEAKCSLFSYYPYSDDGVIEKSCEISVGVKTDQSTLQNYNQSDFMTAEVDELSAQDSDVELDYQHRHTRLNFIINVTDDSDMEELLKMNPSVTLGELYTSATYDISTGEFSDYHDMSDITPYTNWYISGKSLVGAKAVIVPQTVDSQRNFIRLSLNGQYYGIKLNEDYKFTSGKELNVVISYRNLDNGIEFQCSVGTWKDGGTLAATFQNLTNYGGLLLNVNDFDTIPIYNVYVDSKPVAQICRELLYNDEIKRQAIVSYPYRDGNVDLTDGTVLQLIGEDNAVHGGKVAWNVDYNTFEYTGGTENAISVIYYTKDGELKFDQTNVYSYLTVERVRLPDVRGDVTTYYNIVKIGTQYWLCENLSATVYNDGKNITKRASATSSVAAGYYNNDGNIFYNQNAVESGKLAPVDYRVANYMDWSALKSYLHKDASLLKPAGQWGENGNDMTGFCAVPCGAFSESSEGVSQFGDSGVSATFWVMNYQQTSAWSSAMTFTTGSNEFQNCTYSSLSGYSVRCIKIR